LSPSETTSLFPSYLFIFAEDVRNLLRICPYFLIKDLPQSPSAALKPPITPALRRWIKGDGAWQRMDGVILGIFEANSEKGDGNLYMV
jgi:hypothetical protein